MSGSPIKVIVDSGVGSVYLILNDDPISTQVTHTFEKHGILLHWDGHGKLMGIEVIASGRPVRIRETNNIEGEMPAWDSSTA